MELRGCGGPGAAVGGEAVMASLQMQRHPQAGDPKLSKSRELELSTGERVCIYSFLSAL